MTTIIAFLLLPPLLFLLVGLIQLKSIRSFENFALDRDAFGSLAIYCSILASGVGAGVIMGNAEKAYQGEWIYPLGCLGFSLQLLLTARLAPRIYRWRDCLSTGEILGNAYGGNDVRFIAGTLWLLFCVGIVAAQVIAMIRVVNILVPGWEVPIASCLIAAVILYSSLGGIRSVVTTDVVQAIILLLSLVVLAVWGVNHIGGIEPISQLFLDHNSNGYKYHLNQLPPFIIIFLGFLLGDALIPTSIQRITMARSHSDAARAMRLTAAATFIVILLCGLIGIIAFQLQPEQDSLLTFQILLSEMPLWLKLLVVTGLLAAIMSSCDSDLNTAAIAFSHDMLSLVKTDVSDRQQLILGRAATLLIGASAIVIAFQVNDILDVLLGTFEVWGPTLLPPLFIALFYQKLPRINFYLPCISGLTCLFFWKWFTPESTLTTGGLLAGISGNLFCTMLLLWRTRNKTAVTVSRPPP